MTTKVKSVNVVEPPELSLLSEESVRKFREAHASYVMLADKAARKEQHHCIPVNVARMVEILFTTAAKSNPSLKELSPEWMDDPPKKPVMNAAILEQVLNMFYTPTEKRAGAEGYKNDG